MKLNARTRNKMLMTRPDFVVPWKQDIWDKVHLRGEDCVLAAIGKRRKGKSTTVLGLCEAMDEGFNEETLEDRCFMHPIKFLEWARKPKKNLYPGLALMFDEVGVGLPSREWQQFNNRASFKIMQIMGHKAFYAMFTLPNLGFMDAGPRSLIDYLVEVIDIDHHDSLNICKVKQLWVNAVTGKYTTPFMRYRVNGVWYRYSQYYRFKRPSRSLMKAYNNLQEGYKQDFEEDTYLEAKRFEKIQKDKAERKMLDLNDIVREILKKRGEYVKKRGPKNSVDIDLLQYDFNLGKQMAMKVKKVVEREVNRDVLF